MTRANATPARTSTASLSERRNAASAKLARQRAQTLAADRRRRQRQATGQANQKAGMYRNIRSGKSRPNANQQAAQSLLSAGYRNLAGDKNRSTLGQQFMSGIRNLMRGETLPGDNQLTAKPITTGGPSTRLPPPIPDITGDPNRELPPEVMPSELPPEIIEDYSDRFPTGPQYPGMSGGLGGFGYSPNLMRYESQQGAGQVPYYMAAARNAQTPNMSPAFMHAARNYDILGGSQRTAPRPIEMMSARERAEIMNMGSNFNTPNYNSPYQPSPRSEFDYFRQMVGDQPQSAMGSGGKGAGRPPMSQEQTRAMGSGLASLMSSGMFG